MPPPSLGVVTNERGAIVHIEPNRPAANAGLKVGDVLISVGPIKVLEDPQGVRNYLAVLGWDKNISVIYNSNGKITLLEVPLPSLESVGVADLPVGATASTGAPAQADSEPPVEVTELPIVEPVNKAYPEPLVEAINSTVTSVNRAYPEPPVETIELPIVTPTIEGNPEYSTPIPEYPIRKPTATGVYLPFQYF
jgi:hypothetical protein